jgi:leader peptidase (prepilin peptidase)/N-methyltransferase
MFDLGLIDAIGADPVAFAASAAAIGLLVGSFLNVVILRLPPLLEWQWKQDAREMLALPETYEPSPPGIVVESSHCPHCQHKLAAWENVPLLSYALLRGRCRKCKAPISLQYPAVELLTGLLFLACAVHFGYGPAAGLGMVFMAFLVVATGIDLRTTLLPDPVTLPLLWIGLLASLRPVFVSPQQAMLGAAAGYLSLWSVYRLFKLVTGKEGMGYGDFKLLAALGAWCGIDALLPLLMISSVVGAVVGGAWLLIKGRDSATQIPFGPYLAIAGAIEFFSGFGTSDFLRLFAPG